MGMGNDVLCEWQRNVNDLVGMGGNENNTCSHLTATSANNPGTRPVLETGGLIHNPDNRKPNLFLHCFDTEDWVIRPVKTPSRHDL